MKFLKSITAIVALLFLSLIDQSQQGICTSAGQQVINLNGIDYTILCEAGPAN